MPKKRRNAVSAATRAKLSKASKGRHASAATRAKQSKASRGRHASKATRAKESKAQKGKHRTAAQRAAQSKRLKGTHHRGVKRTAAQKAAQSARLKGKHHKGHKASAAARAAESARMKGKKRPHKGHPHKTASRSHGRRLSRRIRRERIYPSRFAHGRNRLPARFKKGRAIRGLRSPFARGRHHVRDWRGRSGRRR